MTNIQKYADEAVALRRAIHKRPEEGWTEFETRYRVVTTLEKLGYAVKCGLAVIDPKAVLGRNEALVAKAQQRALEHGVPQAFLDRLEGYTGAVAELDTGRAGPTTAFRFDMDCVLVSETTDPEHVPNKEGFASEIPGLMHACGHDSHTASGLGFAHWLMDNKDKLTGRVRLIFQPAEEGTRGAGAMAAAGVVDDVDWMFGAHVGVTCKSGEIGIIRHGFLATAKIDIEFEGTPSHAGSDPEKGRSALVAAAACTMMLQGIPRHSGGDSRVAIGTLHAGEGRNVTPVHAKMQIEVRGETGEVSDWMVDRVVSIVKGVSEAYEVKGSWVKAGEATVMNSNQAACDVIDRAAKAEGLTVKVYDKMGGSEDCSILQRRAQQHGAKTAFFFWGCDHHGHHRPDFEIQDTVNMPRALAVLTDIVTETNGQR